MALFGQSPATITGAESVCMLQSRADNLLKMAFCTITGSFGDCAAYGVCNKCLDYVVTLFDTVLISLEIGSGGGHKDRHLTHAVHQRGDGFARGECDPSTKPIVAHQQPIGKHRGRVERQPHTKGESRARFRLTFRPPVGATPHRAAPCRSPSRTVYPRL